ncbi:MAG: type II secretion system protein GspG [Halioglobus sp.]
MLALTMYALLNGCANQTELAKVSLSKKVNSDFPVEFKDLTVYPGGVSCGQYKSYDKWGSGGRFRPFLVKDDVAITHPVALDIAIFCSDNPAASLYSMLGIKASDVVRQIRTDFQQVRSALELFYQRNSRYPSTSEGLEALVVPAKYGRELGPLEKGGYLASIPQDPWNRAYIYHLSGLAGVKRDPQISTLGADAAVGGQDEDADVNSQYVKYLDHIETM